MASFVQKEIVNTTSLQLWSFILQKECWATLIPGYLHHELKSADEMIWVFKGDFGFVEKAVKVELKVTDKVEQERLQFDLKGLSDNINGSGYFEMKEKAMNEYELTGSLDLKAGGFLASVVNPVLESYVPKTTEALVKSMAEQLRKTVV